MSLGDDILMSVDFGTTDPAISMMRRSDLLDAYGRPQDHNLYYGTPPNDPRMRITTGPMPDVRVLDRRHLVEFEDRLKSVAQALTDLDHDLQSIPQAKHLAEDAQAQIEELASISEYLVSSSRDPRPHVVWSVV